MGPWLGTGRGGSIAADFGSGTGTARAQQGAGGVPVPGSEQSCCPQCKAQSVYPVTPPCLRRSQLLRGHHDNPRGHRGEGGRLQHLPLPQRGLVEASTVLQARVPGQAGSVAAPPGRQPAHGDDGDDDGDEGTASQQGPQPALRWCHRSRDRYLQGGLSLCPLQLLSPLTHSVPAAQGSALLWESPVLGLGQDSRNTARARPWPPRHRSIHCSHFLQCGSWGFSHLFI